MDKITLKGTIEYHHKTLDQVNAKLDDAYNRYNAIRDGDRKYAKSSAGKKKMESIADDIQFLRMSVVGIEDRLKDLVCRLKELEWDEAKPQWRKENLENASK